MTEYQVTISNEILNLIIEIDDLKSRWQAINKLLLNRLKKKN